MILSYGLRNFANFKEGVEVSFELKTTSSKKISKGKPYTTVLCVNGANASGKTNLLKGLYFLSEFCCNSFDRKPDDEIPFNSHFSSEKPSDFFVEFISGKVKYRYELTLTKKRILSEKVYRIKQKSSLLFERKNNTIINCISEFKELKGIKKIRSNASIISIANQHEILCMFPVYLFFLNIASNVMYFGFVGLTGHDTYISKIYKNNKKLFNFVKEIICKSDLGISDIKIMSREDKNGQKVFFPIFYHYRSDTKTSPLFYDQQSSGTKTLYLNLALYWFTLQSGGVLVMDEFDVNLHPHMLPHLLELFTDPKINKQNAQLIFTTHNIGILDSMGKYRTFTLNKRENESFGYRFDEILGDILRNDRSIVPAYNSGKIGGIPKI